MKGSAVGGHDEVAAGARVLPLRVESAEGAAPGTLVATELAVAGWTGRDRAATEAHIRELEALGVARPPTTPVFYRVSAARLTLAPAIEVVGRDSSGEVEFVLMGAGGGTWVGVGSDHTDRKVEAYGVTVSKQMCDKPLAPAVWPWEEVADHFDDLVLRSWVVTDGRRKLYQEGRAADLLPPGELLREYAGTPAPAEGVVVFGGTLPARGGVRPADRFEGELEDPVRGRSLRFGYDVKILPVRG